MTDLAPELLNWLDAHLSPGEGHSVRDGRSWTRSLAGYLNRRELWEPLDGQTFGAWSDDDAGLGHLVFHSNRLLPNGEAERRARLVNCVLDEVRRLAWLDEVWAQAARPAPGEAARQRMT